MPNKARPFRSEESHVAERITRGMVVPFLEQKGFTFIEDKRRRYGSNESQIVAAIDQRGSRVKLHVQTCWRRGRGSGGANFSAAQLMAAIRGNDWEGSIREKVARSQELGVTHSLFVQRDGARFVFAARVPLDAIWPIWNRQREVSKELADKGLLGRQTKNHAANGNSPTIWLQDDRTPEAHQVADVLWTYTGVADLARLPDMTAGDDGTDDTYDDCPLDLGQLGADGAGRVTVVRSQVKRDPRVRAAVLVRAKGECERQGCGASRPWAGFLDVHHILGADKSDRVWNCVALCPNCHREAHYSPEHDSLNAELLSYAGERDEQVAPS